MSAEGNKIIARYGKLGREIGLPNILPTLPSDMKMIDRLREFMMMTGTCDNWHTIKELAAMCELPELSVGKIIYALVSNRRYLALKSRKRGRISEYILVVRR